MKTQSVRSMSADYHLCQSEGEFEELCQIAGVDSGDFSYGFALLDSGDILELWGFSGLVPVMDKICTQIFPPEAETVPESVTSHSETPAETVARVQALTLSELRKLCSEQPILIPVDPLDSPTTLTPVNGYHCGKLNARKGDSCFYTRAGLIVPLPLDREIRNITRLLRALVLADTLFACMITDAGTLAGVPTKQIHAARAAFTECLEILL